MAITYTEDEWKKQKNVFPPNTTADPFQQQTLLREPKKNKPKSRISRRTGPSNSVNIN